jgi:OmpA-OmpF porin, OOP family
MYKHISKLKIALLALCMAAIFEAKAQRPYYIGVSAHWVNLNLNQKDFDYFDGKNWQPTIGPTKISVGIPLSDHLSVMPTASLGVITVPGKSNNSTFWNLDANLVLSAGKRVLEPYIMAGVGTTRLNATSYLGVNGGLGLNIWLTEGFALNAQTNYNYLFGYSENAYFQNSIGIGFGIGGGPKDSDKDGVPDDTDACPKVKGTAATQGCPDADGDGIADKDDACPSEAGTAATQGCPDKDGDGVADAKDACPTEAGKPENGGCPDTDGDGILDKDDACPREKGTIELKGCADTDGDGIKDSEDECPSEKGTVANKGCPDRDGDGIVDKSDNCPDQAGVAARQGCPEIKAEEVKALETKLNVAAKQIQFETAKATIKPNSFDDLDQIVAIMNQYPTSRFRIEGHTDNTGNAANNKTLSDQRATAVENYITSKGIAAARLDSEGFGSEKPIGNNATAAGRTLNRRVEIHLAQ